MRKVRMKVNKFLAPVSQKDAAPHYFTERQIRFLELYSQTLDVESARKEAGMTLWQIQKSPYLQNEIAYINRAAMYRHRVKSSVGNHGRLMEKFERDYDSVSDRKFKSAIAGTLSRMSETALKVAGEFSESKDAGGILGVQVVINIGVPEETKVVDVTPRKEMG